MKKLVFYLAVFGLTFCYITLQTFNCKAQTYSFCPGDTITHDLPTYRGSLQWQESTDSLSWSDITGATYQPFITVFATAKYFRAKITEASCNPVYSQVRHAVSGTCFTCGISIVSDIDGNVYNTIEIGSQCWMKENLKTSKYSNGTSIPKVTDGSTWIGLNTGAFCYYNNDSSTNAPIYGALYNWFAATEVNNLCPVGWHLPTHDEWTTFERILCSSGTCSTDFPFDLTTGGWRGTNEGGKLKEDGLVHWTSPNTGATNSSGFSMLPGGCRNTLGNFSSINNEGFCWSSSEDNPSNAWRRDISYNFSQIGRNNGGKTYGFSVRCLRDF